jgi:hypothetical protein
MVNKEFGGERQFKIFLLYTVKKKIDLFKKENKKQGWGYSSVVK